MPRPGQPSVSSDGATTARWPPEQRRVAVPPVESRWGPPRPRPVNNQALRTEESTSPDRNNFQDWELLQKALTFQRFVGDTTSNVHLDKRQHGLKNLIFKLGQHEENVVDVEIWTW